MRNLVCKLEGGVEVYEDQLDLVQEALDEEPTAPVELAQDMVARIVRDAYLASAELYRLQLNPETASLLAKEEGDLWSIQSRITSVVKGVRANHA